MASDLAARWPHYRKFSSALSRRDIALRALLTVGVAGTLALAFSPADNAAAQAAVPVRYVTLPRVVVTAKREALPLAATAPAAAVRLVVNHQ